MDNLVAVQIVPTSRKKKKERKALERKIKKLYAGWQITDKDNTTTTTFSATSLKTNSKDENYKSKDTERKKQIHAGIGTFKPLDDVTRLLLEMTSSSSNAHSQVDAKAMKECWHEKNDAAINVDGSNSNKHSESTVDILSEDDNDPCPLSARTDEKSVNNQTLQEYDHTMGSGYNMEEDNLSQEKNSNDSQVSSVIAPRFGSQPSKSLSRVISKKNKRCNNKPILIEMKSSHHVPRHHLLTRVSTARIDSTTVPFQYKRVISAVQHPSTNSVAHRAMDYFTSNLNNISTENTASPFVIHTVPNNKVLLGMKYSSILFFRGKLSLSVVFGTVEVLGYEMIGDGSEKCYTVYSPRGVSLLGVQACSVQSTSVDWNKTSNRLVALGLDSSHVEDIVSELNDADCLLVLQNFPCALVSFLNVHFPLKLFPSLGSLHKTDWRFHKAEEKLQCEFVLPETEENVKLYSKPPDWKSCIKAITSKDSLRTVLCGGKAVGKSTFLRFLINQSLVTFKEVLCLDFDPGQSEFTIPGCVSAVVVREPLLGPNYTHLHSPHRMVYVGDINMAQCPTRYLQCVQHIMDYCRSQPQLCIMPWFINTMGFSKGLGVELIVNLIRMVGPSDVVQIQSNSKKRNYPEHLDSLYVSGYQSTLHHIPQTSYSDVDYSFHVLPSAAESSSQGSNAPWGMEAHRLRDLVILSYLSQIVTPPNHSFTEIVPFGISFSQLKLCVCHEAVRYSQYLTVMNANLVALCSAGDEDVLTPSDPEYPQILVKPPVCPCLGFGIVRGVDMEEKQLFLISPLSESELSQVNCLVLGPVSLPESVRLNAEGITGHVPYVTAGAGQPTGRIMRHSRSAVRLPKRRVLL